MLENIHSHVFIHKLLAQHGKRYSTIANLLMDEFNILASEAQIEAIHKAARDKIARYRQEFVGKLAEQYDYSVMMNKANLLLKRRLNRAIRNDEKLEALNTALELGSITKKEYSLRKHALETLSVSEVIKIVDRISPFVDSGSPVSLSENVIETKKSEAEGKDKRDALIKAMSEGNTVEVQRLMWASSEQPQTIEGETIKPKK